jgi:hypothetical protein
MNSPRVYQKICKLADYMNAVRVDLKNSLIINGFWRSGTTWIMESAASLLEAKIVFEPFNPPNPNFTKVSDSPLGPCLPEMGLPRTDHAFIRGCMPYIQAPLDEDSQVVGLVKRSLHGVHPYRSSLNSQGWAEKNLAECLRPRVVTKFTRGALCLRPIQDAFGIPILHVVRDPRSVIASLKKTQSGNLGWGAFNNFPLKEQLLGIQDGRAAYFSQWQDDIEKYDQKDDFSRLAAYYCLTEHYLLDSFRTAQGPFKVVHYETIVENGPAALQSALADLGLNPESQQSIDLSRSSITDWNNQIHSSQSSPKDRIFALRNQLTKQQLSAIEEVVTYFGMENRLWDESVPALAS